MKAPTIMITIPSTMNHFRVDCVVISDRTSYSLLNILTPMREFIHINEFNLCMVQQIY